MAETNTVKVVTDKDIGDGLSIKEGKLVAVGELSNIPEKDWETDSKVIAFDPQGNLYQFAQPNHYYKDVGIGLSAGSGVKLENGNAQYPVTAQIYNTKNIAIPTATVVLSAGGTMRDFAVSSADNVQVTSESAGAYTLTNLGEYGVVTVTFNVEVSENTYVSGSVSAVGDTNRSNNSSTLNLKTLATSQQKRNTYTESCPYVQATAVGFDEPLAVGVQYDTAENPYELTIYKNNGGGGDSQGLTIIPNVQSLNGVQLQLQGASTIRVFVSKRINRQLGATLIEQISETQYKTWFAAGNDFEEATSADYSFDQETGLLTFNSDIYGAMIFLRPAGSACKWQTYWVGALEQTTDITTNVQRIRVEGVDEARYSYVYSENSPDKQFKALTPIQSFVNEIKILGKDTSAMRSFNDQDYWTKNSSGEFWGRTSSSVSVSSVLHINLNVGEAYEFDIFAGQGSLPELQGNISIQWADDRYHVVVKPTATATDDVYRDKVRITIS